MPGRDARAACSSSMSAARSITACLAASFCSAHSRPPICASVGRLLLPPTYFCTSSIFDGRHVDFRAAVEFELEMLFDLVVLFQQLQAAIAADAVRQVDDVVPFAQLEKAVDHAAQPAPRWAASDRRDETVRCR